STFAKTICADPSLLDDRQADAVARAVAPLLQIDSQALYKKLATRNRTNEKGVSTPVHYVRIKQRVPQETWEKIQAVVTNLSFGVDEKKLNKSDQLAYRVARQKGVYGENFPIRVYPNQFLAAHVLGYAQTEDAEINGNVISEI